MVTVPTIEPVTPRLSAATGETSVGGGAQVDLPNSRPQQPSAADAQDFARLAGISATDAQVAPSLGGGLMDRIAHQADLLSQHMRLAGAAPATRQAPGATGAPNLGDAGRDTMSTAMSQMEHAYMVAIETTMASRGSTESTKIFNTLLKGQ